MNDLIVQLTTKSSGAKIWVHLSLKNFPSLINLISVDDFKMASKNKQCGGD